MASCIKNERTRIQRRELELKNTVLGLPIPQKQTSVFENPQQEVMYI